MIRKEVVTLQVGHYANFVGTHWWNLQEAGFTYNCDGTEANQISPIDSDVMFREGKNLQGDVTYTPRLVAVDRKGSLKTLKQHGILYDLHSTHSQPLLNNDVTLHQAAPVVKNEFLSDLDRLDGGSHEGNQTEELPSTSDIQQHSSESPQVFGPKYYNLDSTVSVWSDYLKIHLHPQSIALLDTHDQDGAEEAFDVYTYGLSSLDNSEALANIDDRLHYFVEECDSLQGIQHIVDAYSGFAGVSTRLLQALHDDYSPKSILTYAVYPPVHQNNTKKMQTKRTLSSALAIEALSNYSSLVVPLSLSTNLANQPSFVSFPHLSYKADLAYHTSAILAASIDTVSLPYRLRSPNLNLSSLTNTLSSHSRKVSSLFTCLPLPISNTSLTDTLLQYNSKSPWQPLTPFTDLHTTPDVQSVVLQAAWPNQNRNSQTQRQTEEVLQQYVTESYPSTLSGACYVQNTSCVKAPFPHIFSSKIDKHGCLSESNRPSRQGVEQISCLASLQSNSSVKHFLKHLHSRAASVNIRQHHQFLSTSFEEDDYKEAVSRLHSLIENY